MPGRRVRAEPSHLASEACGGAVASGKRDVGIIMGGGRGPETGRGGASTSARSRGAVLRFTWDHILQSPQADFGAWTAAGGAELGAVAQCEAEQGRRGYPVVQDAMVAVLWYF